MHQSILAKRKAEAVNRITWTAGALVAHFEGNPALTQELEPKGVKDPAAAEMMRLEALSDLLTWVALHVGAIKESASVTVETAPELAPVVEPIPAPAPVEDLPAPVFEDEETPKPARKPGRKKKE